MLAWFSRCEEPHARAYHTSDCDVEADAWAAGRTIKHEKSTWASRGSAKPCGLRRRCNTGPSRCPRVSPYALMVSSPRSMPGVWARSLIRYALEYRCTS